MKLGLVEQMNIMLANKKICKVCGQYLVQFIVELGSKQG